MQAKKGIFALALIAVLGVAVLGVARAAFSGPATQNADGIITTTGGGNIGVGTTGPGAKLEVSDATSPKIRIYNGGGASPNPQLELYRNASAYGYIEYKPAGGSGDGLVFHDARSDGAAKIIFSTYTGGEKMRITDAGNVGIATTTPAYTLTVVGTGSFSQPVIVGTPTLDTHAATKSYVDSTVGGFWTATGTNIYNSNAGNVGIGTSAPNVKLDVRGSVQVGAGVYSSTPGATTYLAISDNTITNSRGLQFYAADGTYNPRATIRQVTASNDHYVEHISSFSSGSGYADWVFTYGNVGIGTTTPSQKLDVVGTVEATNFADATGGYNVNLGSNGTEGRGLVAGYSGGSYGGIGYNIRHTTTGGTYIVPGGDKVSYILFSGGGFVFQGEGTGTAGRTANLSTYMIIKDSGSVGIATTTPAYTLTVVGTGSFSQPVIVGTPTLDTHAATKSYVDSTVGGFWTATGTNIYNSNAGNVGIGTSAPGNKLQIETNSATGVESTGDNIQLRVQNTSTTGYSGIAINRSAIQRTAGTYYQTAGTTDWYTGTSYNGGGANSSYSIGTDRTLANSKLVVTTTGNVGIGITSPTSLLHVNGGTTSADWPFSVNGKIKVRGDGVLNWGAGADYGLLSWNTGVAFVGGMSGKALGLYSGGVEKVRIDTSGSVGIATTTPAYTLTVVGTGSFSQPVIVGTPTLDTHAATKSYVDSTVGGFWTATGTNIYNSNAGNVGIGTGTSTPTAKLDVNGALSVGTGITAPVAVATGDILAGGTFAISQFDQSAGTQYFQQSNAGTGAINIWARKSRGTTAAPTVITTADDLLLIRAYGHDGTSFVESSRITFDSTGTIGTGIIPGVMRFTTADAAGAMIDRMTLNSTGLLTIDQNDDSAALYIDKDVTNENNANDGVNITVTSVVNNAGTYTKSQEAFILTSNVTETSGTITDTSDTLSVNQTHADNTGQAVLINSDATGGQALYIDAENTTVDAMFLDTVATTGHAVNVTANSLTSGTIMRLYSNSADTTARFLLNITNDNVAATGAIPLRVQQDSTGDIVNFFDGATEVFTILDGGSVGISDATPSYALDVTGTIRATSQVLAGANGAAYFCGGDDACIYDANVTNTVNIRGAQNTAVGSLQLGSDTTAYLYGLTGNIGIGTTGPTTKLDVHLVGDGIGGITMSRSGGTGDPNKWILWSMDEQAGYGDDFEIWQYPGSGGSLQRFSILDNGNVVINNSVTALSFYYSSDISLKTDISPLGSMLGKVGKLNGVNYRWKDTGKWDIGLIAQDVEKIFPEYVLLNEETGLKSVDYAKLTVPLIEAVKEQQTQMDELRAEIDSLKKDIGNSPAVNYCPKSNS